MERKRERRGKDSGEEKIVERKREWRGKESGMSLNHKVLKRGLLKRNHKELPSKSHKAVVASSS